MTALLERPRSANVTAEIPAIPPGWNYGVLLPDGSIWYPASQKKLPAPLILRVVVWSLAFLVLVAGAGDFVIRAHPHWVDPLRPMVAAAATARLGTTPRSGGPVTTGGGTSVQTAGSLLVDKLQPAGLSLNTTAYTITGVVAYEVDVKATALTWIQACHVVNGVIETGSPLFSGDLQAGQLESIPATGIVDLQIGAAGTTVTVLNSGTLLGTAAVPASVPWHLRFEPAS